MPPSSRRTKRRKSLLLLLSSKWRAWHRTLRPACARQTTSERSPRTSRWAFLSILVAACTLDMASRILPEYPVPIPAGRQGVSPANVLGGVGPRRASVGAGLESCNGNDRRQRRKQGVAVGAAASKTQAIAKRLLGAATRRCSRRKLPAGLLTTIAVTVSFQLTVLIQAHPHPKTGERCAF